ncbi:prostatic acid phosphatase-like [Physella acuta]|uniref:prostatic acid phosphatase-like n=1 Tax=Physella acuta TaxID=109671 RepID=UPI0027DB9ABB|nr:prostatic acid phosphatase-like [Physella acuta]XP_059148937.1 prostatic acid phosphatase-like [Physella acuta]
MVWITSMLLATVLWSGFFDQTCSKEIEETHHELNFSRKIQSESSTVVLVQVIHRHGDRSQTSTYPNDPNKNSWPQGFGQLTTMGMNQGFELGQFLQSWYGELIDKVFNHTQVSIRSTDYARTLMTAECVAAGLFSQADRQNHSVQGLPSINWQPVPIYSVPKSMDRLLRPSSSCEYINDLRSEVEVSFDSQQELLFQKELMLNLSRFTGMDINATSLHYLADIVFCQNSHNMTQPKWLTPDIQTQLYSYKQNKASVTAADAKYLSGTLLETLINNIQAKMKGSQNKMYLYSAHESPLRFLMALLGVDTRLEVPYAAAVIVELHQIEGKHLIRLFYRNSTTQAPHVLVAAGCPNEMCPFHIFNEVYQKRMLTDKEWDDICIEAPYKSFVLAESLFPLLVGVLVAFIGLDVFLGFKLFNLHNVLRHGPHLEQYALLEAEQDHNESDVEFELEEMHTKVKNEDLKQNNGGGSHVIDSDESI